MSESPPLRPAALAPGLALGGAVGGGLVGVTDALTAAAARGFEETGVAVTLAALALALAGAVVAVPWGLALSQLVPAHRVAAHDNPRWTGFVVATCATGWIALSAGGPLHGQPAGQLAAGAAAFAIAIAGPLGVRTSRGRVLAMLGLIALLATPPAVAERPGPIGWPPPDAASVLLVTVDGLASRDLAHPRAVASLRALAQQGVLWPRAATPAPERQAAHRALWGGPSVWAPSGLASAEVEHAADDFRRAGWQTAAFVSHAELAADGQRDQGFSRYDDERSWAVGAWSTAPGRLVRRLRAPEPVRRGDRTVDRVVSWLDRQPEAGGRPMLLWVHLADGAAPFQPPPPWDTAFYAGDPYDPAHGGLGDAPASVSRAFPDVTDPARVQAARLGGVAHADAQVGRLVESLPEGRWVVAVAGAWGSLAGEGGLWTAEAPALSPETVAVPLVISAPGRLPRGAEIHHPVELTDLLPTLAELAGREAEQHDGASLVPVAFGRRPRPVARSVLPGVGPLLLDQSGAWDPRSDGLPPTEAHAEAEASARAAGSP